MYSYQGSLNKSHASWEVRLHWGELHVHIKQWNHEKRECCQKGSETACEDRWKVQTVCEDLLDGKNFDLDKNLI